MSLSFVLVPMPAVTAAFLTPVAAAFLIVTAAAFSFLMMDVFPSALLGLARRNYAGTKVFLTTLTLGRRQIAVLTAARTLIFPGRRRHFGFFSFCYVFRHKNALLFHLVP